MKQGNTESQKCANCSHPFNKFHQKARRGSRKTKEETIVRDIKIIDQDGSSSFTTISVHEALSSLYNLQLLNELPASLLHENDDEEEGNEKGLLNFVLCQKCTPLLTQFYNLSLEFRNLGRADSYLWKCVNKLNRILSMFQSTCTEMIVQQEDDEDEGNSCLVNPDESSSYNKIDSTNMDDDVADISSLIEDEVEIQTEKDWYMIVDDKDVSMTGEENNKLTTTTITNLTRQQNDELVHLSVSLPSVRITKLSAEEILAATTRSTEDNVILVKRTNMMKNIKKEEKVEEENVNLSYDDDDDAAQNLIDQNFDDDDAPQNLIDQNFDDEDDTPQNLIDQNFDDDDDPEFIPDNNMETGETYVIDSENSEDEIVVIGPDVDENSASHPDQNKVDKAKDEVKCDKCFREFRYVRNLRAHKKHCPFVKNSQNNDEKQKRPTRRLKPATTKPKKAMTEIEDAGEDAGSKKQRYACPLCLPMKNLTRRKFFDRKDDIIQHWIMFHMNYSTISDDNDDENSNDKSNENIHICPFCTRFQPIQDDPPPASSYSFPDLTSLKSHLTVHAEEDCVPNRCFKCKKKFSKSGYLLVHLRGPCVSLEDHEEAQPSFQCPVSSCHQEFPTRHHLLFHSKTHEDQPFTCDRCYKKSFESESDLQAHKVNCSGPVGGKYSCPTCSKTYTCKQAFTSHLQRHTGEGGMACPTCGKVFYRPHAYKTHLYLHLPDSKRPFVCPHEGCGRGFVERKVLKNHILIHTGHRPHLCNHCGSAFREFKVLQHHLFTHEDERRFKCTICSKAFQRPDVLRVHLKSHQAEKDLLCQICGAGFKRQWELTTHLRTHNVPEAQSGPKPHKCSKCNKAFSTVAYLWRHERGHVSDGRICADERGQVSDDRICDQITGI